MTDPFRIEGPALLSTSGGLTSGLMLRRALDAHGGELPHDVHVVFANTGMERHETLEFVREIGDRWNVEIRWLERDASKPAGARFREVTYETASRQGDPFADLIRGRSFLPNAVMRFCTSDLKVLVMRDFMRSLGYAHWENVVGLRYDEARRVASVRAKSTPEWDTTCPLYDARVTVADVAAFWSAQPFRLALKPWEGNCDLCFLKGRAKRERIMADRPDLAAWWIAQEAAMGGRFHAHEKGYAAALERVRRQLPLFDLAAADDDSIPCGCTDRRVRRPRRCACRGGHTLACVLSRPETAVRMEAA